MARKKKTEIIESAEVAEMTKATGEWPKITQGTHLTVKTFEDGHTELIWDHEQLEKEVHEAIRSVEMKPAVKAKVATRKRKEKDNGK